MSAAPSTERRKFHPAADIFPLLDETELSALAADIREHGLLEEIVLHEDGSILDGRNRYLACEHAGVQPRFRHWYGGNDTLISYVVSLNLHRRHLSESQRAMVAAKIATLEHGQHQTGKFAALPTQREAAALVNVSERSVRSARSVIDSGDAELVARVEKGEVAVSKAARAVRPKKSRKKPTATKPPAALSRRWLEVKELAEAGCSSRLIAAKAGLKHEGLFQQAHSKGIEIRADRVLDRFDYIWRSCSDDVPKIVVTDDEAVEIRKKIRTVEQWLRQLDRAIADRTPDAGGAE